MNRKERKKYQVYALEMDCDGAVKRYIGVTGQKRPSIRFNIHKYLLKGNNPKYQHPNPYLKEAYDLYGESLRWVMLENLVGTLDDARKKEYEYCLKYKTYDSRYGFNVCQITFFGQKGIWPKTDFPVGRGETTYQLSEEERKKRSEWMTQINKDIRENPERHKAHHDKLVKGIHRYWDFIRRGDIPSHLTKKGNKRRSEILKEYHQDPKWRKEWKKSLMDSNVGKNSPEGLEIRSEKMKALHADPVWRANWEKKMAEGQKRRRDEGK